MLIEKIEEYYIKRNLNCTETMLSAANDVYQLGLDKNALKMAAGFGGGMYVGSTCGALAGGIMVIGRLFVEDNAHGSPKLKGLVREFLQRYHEKMGEVNCANLKAKYYKGEVRCLDVVKEAGIILDEIIRRELNSTKGTE